jgi:hypothetical protein
MNSLYFVLGLLDPIGGSLSGQAQLFVYWPIYIVWSFRVQKTLCGALGAPIKWMNELKFRYSSFWWTIGYNSDEMVLYWLISPQQDQGWMGLLILEEGSVYR